MDSTSMRNKQLDAIEEALGQALNLVRNTSRDRLKALTWLDTAAEVGNRLSEARAASGELRQTLVGGARTAILAYLRSHVGEPVPPDAIEGVAGIREWARRIRELRAVGWDIECIGSGPEASYRLNVDRLDQHIALSDSMIANIKSVKQKERIIEYLLNVAPWPATSRQLERVAGSMDWEDDLHALIGEGWLIRSSDNDPAVPVGSYRLGSVDD